MKDTNVNTENKLPSCTSSDASTCSVCLYCGRLPEWTPYETVKPTKYGNPWDGVLNHQCENLKFDYQLHGRRQEVFEDWERVNNSL